MSRQTEKQPFTVKIYLVVLAINTAKNGESNRKIIAAKLTEAAALHLSNQIPGSRVVRMIADKTLDNVDLSSV